jgi:formimidoylglutamate deiminase
MATAMETRLFAPSALLPEGWAEDVVLEIGEEGSLKKVLPNGSPADCKRLKGAVLPGMPNLHSHAFQRAMAGLAEQRGSERDSFWSWREVMYGFVSRLNPRQLEAVASQLYLEMLKAGYTSVCEFHYLHHDPEGVPYADPAEMSRRVLAAAERSGIGITLLPVFYAQGDFGGAPAGEGQKRFLHSVESFETLLSKLRPLAGGPQKRLGIAPHSLRAVTPESLSGAVQAMEALDSSAPIHIHIAEQLREVERCRSWSGKRPVRWLLDNQKVDSRWCLVHATHMTPEETTALADRGAVAGLCPTTEANLGDGFFAAVPFLQEGGVFGIGSDSQVSVSPVEELRWLEYGQRLLHRERNLLVEEGGRHVGASLYRAALDGGARASGRPLGRLEPGCRADLLVIDEELSFLWGKAGDGLVDALVFAGNANPVRDVFVGGRHVVSDGRHAEEERIFADYKAALSALRASA